MMRGLFIGLWLGLAGVAAAEPYCKPTAAELAALPSALAGAWQGRLMQGVAVQDGKPSLLPTGGAPAPAVLSVVGGGLGFADATTPAAVMLAPAMAAVDFALPGETPLMAQELLGPLLPQSGCAVGDLPQFDGVAPMAGGVAVRFHAYVVGRAEMLMVMQVGAVGPVAQPTTAVRVVLRYSR